MNNLPRLLGISVLLLANACATNPSTGLEVDTEATSSGKADGVTWLRVYTCDGAVLDTAEAERRELQFVVKDHEAAEYLVSQGTNGLTPVYTASGELIYKGRVDHGVFYPWDFEGMIGVNATYPGSDAYLGATIRFDNGSIVAENYFAPGINWVFRNCY